MSAAEAAPKEFKETKKNKKLQPKPSRESVEKNANGSDKSKREKKDPSIVPGYDGECDDDGLGSVVEASDPSKSEMKKRTRVYWQMMRSRHDGRVKRGRGTDEADENNPYAELDDEAKPGGSKSEGDPDFGATSVIAFKTSLVSKIDVPSMDSIRIGGAKPVRSGTVRTWRSEFGTVVFDPNGQGLVRYEALHEKFPVPMGIKIGMKGERVWTLLGRPDRVESRSGWYIGADDAVPRGSGTGPVGYLVIVCDTEDNVKRIVWTSKEPKMAKKTISMVSPDPVPFSVFCSGSMCSEGSGWGAGEASIKDVPGVGGGGDVHAHLGAEPL